jgi:hypothetical protein
MAKRSGRLDHTVEMPSQLAADLRALTEALDPPRTDLASEMSSLIADIRMTTDTYLGLSMTVVMEGTPFVLLAYEENFDLDDVGSSACVPLQALCDVEPGSSIVFYARERDAFAEFAIEVTTALRLPAGTVVLDQHRTPPPAATDPTTIAVTIATNQAIGVLIDRGSSPAAARTALDELALRRGNAHAAATEILNGTVGGSVGRSVDGIGPY